VRQGVAGILAGDEALATAILDRLLHKSVVLNVRGRSYRLQELEKALMWTPVEGGEATAGNGLAFQGINPVSKGQGSR